MTATAAAPREAFPFAAMLCLYRNNVAEEVREALASAFDEQTCPPALLIAVYDGPIPDAVEAVLADFETRHPVQRVIHPECRGHGPARAAAVDACAMEWLAIIDADDISLPHRFESLIAMATAHPDTAVIGGGLIEFHMEGERRITGATVGYPVTPDAVRHYMRSRCPVGQSTAMLRVGTIWAVGNYQPWFNNEDYYLWLRLISAGYVIRNVDRPLILFRTSPDFFARRGGFSYWKSEVKLQLFSYRQGTTTLAQLLLGSIVRFAVQVCMPGSVRKIFYQRILRKS